MEVDPTLSEMGDIDGLVGNVTGAPVSEGDGGMGCTRMAAGVVGVGFSEKMPAGVGNRQRLCGDGEQRGNFL